MKAAHSKSKNPSAKNYTGFRLLSKVAYQSATHGNRFVQTYGNHYAKNYSAYEKAGTFKLGALLAKDSFTGTGDGKTAVGPMFLMKKMPAGFNKASRDWKYTMIMPDGRVFGATGGKNAAAMNVLLRMPQRCRARQDAVMLLPENSA